MARSRVYVETTVVSYLAAEPSGDLIQAAHQQATRLWWVGRHRFELFASRAVVAEAARGNPIAAARRLEALQGIPNLEFGRDVTPLVRRLMQSGALPPKARMDAALRGKIEEACRAAGTVPPIICTPEELMEAES